MAWLTTEFGQVYAALWILCQSLSHCLVCLTPPHFCIFNKMYKSSEHCDKNPIIHTTILGVEAIPLLKILMLFTQTKEVINNMYLSVCKYVSFSYSKLVRWGHVHRIPSN